MGDQRMGGAAPELLDALSVIVLMCDSKQGFELLKKAKLSNNAEVRRIAENTLEEALRNGQIDEL